MKKYLIIAIVLLTSVLFAFQLIKNDPAIKFLNSLNEEQREITQLPINDQSRYYWHFFPGTMVERAGIQLHELNTKQKELAFELLKVSLSEVGFDKTIKIIDLERVLAKQEGNPTFRDPEKYNIAFYGDPQKDSLWAWSFEGHHVSLNFSILNDKISIAPRFMGANPATIKSGSRKGERTLAKEEDFGLQLINNLTDKQQKTAIFQKTSLDDIVTFNSSKVEPLATVGIKMEQLNGKQQKILMDLIYEYLSVMPIELAKKRLNNVKSEELNNVRFGWAGSTDKSKPHYYRVQGKTFLIEFDNIQNNANHIHSVWRDFDGDFGRDLIKEHYHKSPH